MALIKLTTIRGDKILVNPEFVSDYGTYRCVVSLGQEYMVYESQEQIERMVLRDQFAMAVLPSMPTNPALAYSVADAMLEERGK